ncbi:MAG: exonuclease subunit SbcD [Syntrophales bacterium]|nr:exonuclease subunit SbcD [Syntrophales bacterium]
MKILHTADWHLGKTVPYTGFDFLPLQERILNRLIEIIKQESVDVVIVGGDVFDSPNPPGRAERLFIESLKKIADLSCPTFIIAGNHDSPERLSALNPLSQKHLIFIAGFVKENFSGILIEKDRWLIKGQDRYFLIEDRDKRKTLSIHLLPYASEYRLGEAFLTDDIGTRDLEYAEKIRELIAQGHPFDPEWTILLSHLYVKNARAIPKEERPLFIGGSYFIPSEFFPDTYDYIALGHLHSSQMISKNIAYSGSIIPFTPDVSEREKYVHVIDLKDNSVKKIPLNISELIEIRVASSMDEALEPARDDKILYLALSGLKRPLTSDDIKNLEKAHGERLALFTVEIKTEGVHDEMDVYEISDLSPEEWFRRFYMSKREEKPSSDVMELFLSLIKDEEEDKV